MTRRAERRASRQEEVQVAAMRLVAEDGLEALTIQRIAGAIGASVGGLYRYYDGKDALLAALQQRAIGAVAEDQAKDVDAARKLFDHKVLLEKKGGATDANAGGVASLACALVGATVVLRHADRRPEEHRLLDAFLSAQQAVLSEESAKAADGALVPLVETVARELSAAAGARVLEPGDAVQRTYVLWAALHGLDHFRKRDRILPPNLRVGALVPATLSALVRGWGASERNAGTAIDLHLEFEAATSEAESQSRAKQ